LQKRMDLIQELVPSVSTIGLLINPTNTTAEFVLREVQEAARSRGRQIVTAVASSSAEFDSAFAALRQQGAGALIIGADPFFNGHSEQLGALAAQQRMPAIAEVREFAAAGGLMSYGTSFAYAYRQAGAYTGRILKGEKTADLPVLQPTKFDLILNLKTA